MRSAPIGKKPVGCGRQFPRYERDGVRCPRSGNPCGSSLKRCADPGDLETGPEEAARRLAPGWTAATITAIPGTMSRLQRNPQFGLASPDAGGRAEAMEFVARIRRTVVRLAQRSGRAAVRYVQLHSAPRRTARPDILADSLAQVLGWDWVGAELVIERCDRPWPAGHRRRVFFRLRMKSRISTDR